MGRRVKPIVLHTDEELDGAVEAARLRFGDDFWMMLHGVDAYMERRRRRLARRQFSEEGDELTADPWGNS